MNLDAIVFTVADKAFTGGEVLLAAGGVAMVLLVVTTILSWRAGRARRREALEAVRRQGELETRLAEMAGQLREFSASAGQRESAFARTMEARLEQVSHRLGMGLNESAERTGQSLRQLHERLAVIDRAQASMAEMSAEMLSLKDILANKQARGAFGQARMEAILRDGLPADAYEFQATLSNNTRPDCLVRLPDNEVRIAIDAKFPLEAFNAIAAADDEAAANAARQRLRQDMAKHIKDISSKYLIAGETHETAILFVPSESIYADLYEHFEDIIEKAHKARVILASPNMLMLMIQTLQALFKDARMREQAGLIQTEVSHLLADVERLNERVINLKRHFAMAEQDIDRLEVSSGKIARRGRRIEQLEFTTPAGDSGGGGGDGDKEAPGKPKLVAG